MTNKEPKKILVVEDSKGALNILVTLFKMEKYNVKGAENGKLALDIMVDFIPDLIISDLMMPVMDGYELCKKVRANPDYKNIYFILLSAKQELENKVKGLDTGADEYLTKPFVPNEIKARVRAGLRIKSLIDTLKSKNEELKEKNVELKKLTDLKNEYLGMAAHDLRQPLSAAIMSSDSVIKYGVRDFAEEEIVQIFKLFNEDSKNMLNLLNNILDMSKIESGKVDLNKKLESLNSFLDKQCQMYALLASKKKIQVIREFDPKISRMRFDLNRVSQVITNLLSNALKFTHSGGKIYLRSILKGNEVHIEVEDTGQGIPKNELDLLFIPFKQLSTKSTAGEKGTGLGLAIVKKIVDLHKGKVWVESEVGKGAKFTFTLPRG